MRDIEDDMTVVARARALGVGIMPTHAFYQGESPQGEFLLNYGGLSDETIHEGIARLKMALTPP